MITNRTPRIGCGWRSCLCGRRRSGCCCGRSWWIRRAPRIRDGIVRGYRSRVRRRGCRHAHRRKQRCSWRRSRCSRSDRWAPRIRRLRQRLRVLLLHRLLRRYVQMRKRFRGCRRGCWCCCAPRLLIRSRSRRCSNSAGRLLSEEGRCTAMIRLLCDLCREERRHRCYSRRRLRWRHWSTLRWQSGRLWMRRMQRLQRLTWSRLHRSLLARLDDRRGNMLRNVLRLNGWWTAPCCASCCWWLGLSRRLLFALPSGRVDLRLEERRQDGRRPPGRHQDEGDDAVLTTRAPPALARSLAGLFARSRPRRDQILRRWSRGAGRHASRSAHQEETTERGRETSKHAHSGWWSAAAAPAARSLHTRTR
jgi:hypothetical protein